MATEGKFFSTADSGENYGFLKLIIKSDGSITRLLPVQLTRPQPKPVASKDVVFNAANKTSFRIFRCPEIRQLPILFYFHGGCFLFESAATVIWHNYCELFARELPAIVISVDYRLAPENRLPAAYDDAIETICWVRDHYSEEPWLGDFADISQCYLMGVHNGANITYNSMLRAKDIDFAPLKIRGLIMDQPFIGGVERTLMERRLADDPILPIRAADLIWELSLPEGTDRDHEFCNPLVHEDLVPMLPKIMVRGWRGDPISDRQEEFVAMLERRGIHVVNRFQDGGFTGADLFDHKKAQMVFMNVKEFLHSSS